MRRSRAGRGEGPGFTNFFPYLRKNSVKALPVCLACWDFGEGERRSYLRSGLFKPLNWEVSTHACKLDSFGFCPSLIRKWFPGT